ncbi:MAG: ComF family protein [Thermoleophilia bacterium]
MGTVSPPSSAPGPSSPAWVRRTAGWWREHVADALLATIFPPRCAGCGEFETFLCARCRADLRPAGPERCPRCGHPGASAAGPGWCPACVSQAPTFTSARSAFLHEGPARHLVTSFKYDGLRVLGREMAALAAAEFAALVESVNPLVVTWVPAHVSNTRARGYNQAEVLARELARPLALPVVALASKRRRTGHQRGLDREGRLHNLRGAFAPVEEGVLSSGAGGRSPACAPLSALGSAPAPTRDVVLVDDVFTTGATVAEVSRVVMERWDVRLHVFTFSRTPAGFPQRPD